MHLWLILVLGIAGALAGHHFGQLRRGRSGFTATVYGAAAGVVLAIILPVVFDLVGLLFRLVFTLGVIAVIALAAIAVWRVVRR